MRLPRRLRSRAALLVPLIASAALAAPDNAPVLIDTTPVPIAEVLTKGKERVSELQDTQRGIVEVQEGAKRSRDVIKLNCVNDRMLQMKGLLTVSDSAMSNLNEAVARHDDDSANHEYQRLGILVQKGKVLGTEAQNCVGEDVSYVGGIQVTVEIDPSIPVREVTSFDLPGLDTSRPPSASNP